MVEKKLKIKHLTKYKISLIITILAMLYVLYLSITHPTFFNVFIGIFIGFIILLLFLFPLLLITSIEKHSEYLIVKRLFSETKINFPINYYIGPFIIVFNNKRFPINTIKNHNELIHFINEITDEKVLPFKDFNEKSESDIKDVNLTIKAFYTAIIPSLIFTILIDYLKINIKFYSKLPGQFQFLIILLIIFFICIFLLKAINYENQAKI